MLMQRHRYLPHIIVIECYYTAIILMMPGYIYHCNKNVAASAISPLPLATPRRVPMQEMSATKKRRGFQPTHMVKCLRLCRYDFSG